MNDINYIVAIPAIVGVVCTALVPSVITIANMRIDIKWIRETISKGQAQTEERLIKIEQRLLELERSQRK
ncbi:hypothetical protein ACXOL9_004747 [Vibrio parahaemolyticus]